MTNRGVSLIETIVYLALFTLMIGGLVLSAYFFFENADRNQTKAMMQEEENFLIGKINWSLSGAKSVSIPAAGASGATSTAANYDGTTRTLALWGSDLRLNGTVLNNSNVTISKLVFIHTYAGGTNPESIEAGFTISARTPDGKLISETASTTRYIRN